MTNGKNYPKKKNLFILYQDARYIIYFVTVYILLGNIYSNVVLVNSGFRIQDSGFTAQDSGFTAQDSGFKLKIQFLQDKSY